VKDTGTSNVESVEDDEENKNAQVLEDQLERFTRAVALDDTEMAAQVMQEMGYILFHLPSDFEVVYPNFMLW
jgi:hypothetical protein